MPITILPDRAVLSVSGPDARAFLDRLVTCDVSAVAPGRAAFGALLSPQGKILADFVIHAGPGADDAFLLDTSKSCADDLVRRLNLYRLRAKLAVADVSSTWAVAAAWGEAAIPDGAPDPRLPDLGWRGMVPSDAAIASSPAAYEAHRIALGVPQGGHDYPFGDAFPHEAMMDQLAGVDFQKGCYVGQEVVSRMQHRGTARTRTVPLAFEGADAPPSGSAVTAGERALGRLGSSSGPRALATLRLDRVADAMAAGEPMVAEARPARLIKPAWVRFAFPGEAEAA